MKTVIISVAVFFLFANKECNGQQLYLSNISVFGGKGDGYAVTSFIFTGINGTITAFNLLNFNKEKNKTNAGFALITGLSQIVFCSIYSDHTKSQIGLDILNYSVGSATAVIGSIRLFKKKKAQSSVTLFPYSYPIKNGFMVGLRLTKS